MEVIKTTSDQTWLINVVALKRGQIDWRPQYGGVVVGQLRLQLSDGQSCLLRQIEGPYHCPGGHVATLRETFAGIRKSIVVTERDFERALEYYTSYRAAEKDFPGLTLQEWHGGRSHLYAVSSGPYWWTTSRYPTHDHLVQRLLNDYGACVRVWSEGGYDSIEFAEEAILVESTSNHFTRVPVRPDHEELVAATLQGLLVITQTGRGGTLCIKPIDQIRAQVECEGGNWDTHETSFKVEHGMWWDGRYVHIPAARFKKD